ncbi:sensor histidine kinase [Ktedonospora formicarum]|uniref:histidine kinase n=1 Tax=Ktedonospora formicarum TaxID=2778364 RepID=A0A8J3HZD5_9CHLR|nr:ATP-binding protein [Ktedonospora formicarum]GHO45966.1 hypothetical protein KSX_41290 [Ktedonospora formicarum]
MSKSQQHIMRQQRLSAIPVKKRSNLCATVEPSVAQNEAELFNQYDAIFAPFLDGVIICDQDGMIRKMNDAALSLFEVTCEPQYRPRTMRELLESRAVLDEQQHPLSSVHWLMQPTVHGMHPTEQNIMFQATSGLSVAASVSCSPVLDAQKHIRGTVFIFHKVSQKYQQALHLQRVHEAVQILTESITHLPEYIPEQLTIAWTEGSFLLTPPVVFISQQLVDVVRHVIGCHRVSLKALGQAGRVYYVAGSGFTPEQEAPERATSGLITLSDIFEEPVLTRLFANKEVTIPGNHVHFPPDLESLASMSILMMPLFLEKRFVGLICILKEGVESMFTQEEIELVRAVAAQATLVVECLNYLHEQTEDQTRELVLHEVKRLSNDFLVLASHELRTPLTSILGNLQLAQRRLEILDQQVATQPEQVSKHLEQAWRPLASASQSARIQQRMINNIIDDARIQTNQLELFLQYCDLNMLLNEIVIEQQQQSHGHEIVMKLESVDQRIPVLIDIERVKQVFNTYLTNALTYSPADEPVTVHTTVNNGIAKVSVHNEGSGIPVEEQRHLWDRFYRARGSSVQHELDLSLGLGLYLCQTLIEKLSGCVGVQSAPGQGATFWFTLPIASHSKE